jgi:hypothetical protein
MTGLLAGAKPASDKTPLLITIAGDAGSGKTSLAATFPKPFIIRTRGEAVPRDVQEGQKPAGLAPVGGAKVKVGDQPIWDENELFDQFRALLTEEHDYKTVIIDSVTGLEELFVQNILDVQPAKQKTMNAAGNGYGSSWDTVKAKHAKVMAAAEALRNRKGMHVVFICHVDVKRMDPPDGEQFTKYTLQLHDKTAPIYTNRVDAVAFVKQEVFVLDEKAKTSDARVLVMGMTPANVSKNRLGIEGELKFIKGENPFAAYI